MAPSSVFRVVNTGAQLTVSAAEETDALIDTVREPTLKWGLFVFGYFGGDLLA